MISRISVATILLGFCAVSTDGQIIRQPLPADWCVTRNSTFYQDPYNCERFVRCVDGMKYEFACPPGTRWNSMMVACNYADLTACNTTAYIDPSDVNTPPECPVQVVDGTQRDASNCGRYYRCRRGVRSLEYCPQDLFFNPLSGSCTPFNSLSLAEQQYCNSLTQTTSAPTSSPAPPCPAEVADGKQRDDTNCGRYYRCNNGRSTLEYCSQDLVFNPRFAGCTAFNSLTEDDKNFCLSLITTTIAPITSTPPFCPTEVPDGTQRDPNNCGQYYRCRRGVSTTEVCPMDRYFSVTWGTCLPFASLTQSEKDFCSGITTTLAPATTSSPVVCPDGVINGVQRDPSNCGRFYRCQNGAASLEACNQDLFFNPAWGSCTPYNSLNMADKDFCTNIATTTAPTTPELPFCPPEIADGKQRDSTNCGRFYRCQNGNALLDYCPQGLFFNPAFGSCSPYNALSQAEKDFCDQLNSVTTPSPFCPPEVADGFQRNPEDCNSYFRCMSGSATLMSCPPGQYFSSVSASQPCGRFEDMTQSGQAFCAALEGKRTSDPDVYCVPNVVGFIRDAKNCSQFYRCVNGVPYQIACNEGLYYSTYLQACSVFEDLSPSDKSYCWALEPTTIAPFTCPNTLFALVRHPNDCAKYYICQGGNANMVDCNPGSFFNEQTFRCDPPQQLTKQRYDECVTISTTISPADIVCQGNNGGFLMDFFDQNCRRYYECKLGQITTTNDVFFCPTNFYFNVIKNACTPFDELPPSFQNYCNRPQTV